MYQHDGLEGMFLWGFFGIFFELNNFDFLIQEKYFKESQNYEGKISSYSIFFVSHILKMNRISMIKVDKSRLGLKG